jgi:hypothetical protein
LAASSSREGRWQYVAGVENVATHETSRRGDKRNRKDLGVTGGSESQAVLTDNARSDGIKGHSVAVVIDVPSGDLGWLKNTRSEVVLRGYESHEVSYRIASSCGRSSRYASSVLVTEIHVRNAIFGITGQHLSDDIATVVDDEVMTLYNIPSFVPNPNVASHECF